MERYLLGTPVCLTQKTEGVQILRLDDPRFGRGMRVV